METAQHLSIDSLNAWLDHQLTTDERAVTEAHLASCAICRREAEELAGVKTALAALPQYDVPRSFQLTPEQARRTSAAGQPASMLRVLPTVRALSIAAVMALVIISGALFFGPITDNGGETNGGAESSLTREAAPGEIVDQGQAASNDTGPLSAAAPAAQEAEPAEGESIANARPAPASEDDDGRSPLELTAIGLGVLAVVLVGLWFVLTRMVRATR
ncbi:MAG TPA: zf-HC2 domain-containing protein [Thermomicrobiales bacterium]|nr:zf-HC2 domain-containing protein [Thermomicrobiales bacterium]